MSTLAEPQVNPDQQQKLLATGALFHALAADPRYRKKVLGLIKEAAPDTTIPELDLEGAVLKTVDERIKPQSEEFKKINERLDGISQTLTREKFREQHGLSDDELVDVEELAKKENIGNSSIAVEVYRHRQALGTPRGTRKTPPGTGEYLKKIGAADPRNQKGLKLIAEEEANRIFQTIRKAS